MAYQEFKVRSVTFSSRDEAFRMCAYPGMAGQRNTIEVCFVGRRASGQLRLSDSKSLEGVIQLRSLYFDCRRGGAMEEADQNLLAQWGFEKHNWPGTTGTRSVKFVSLKENEYRIYGEGYARSLEDANSLYGMHFPDGVVIAFEEPHPTPCPPEEDQKMLYLVRCSSPGRT